MDKIERIGAALAGGFLLPAFTFLYGEGRTVVISMILLAILVGFDWLSGWSASRRDGTYSSQYGIEGVARTAIVLMLPAVGNLADQVVGTPSVIYGLILLGLIYHTLKSFVANSIRAGWSDHLPLWIIERLIEFAWQEIEAKIGRATKRKSEKSGSER